MINFQLKFRDKEMADNPEAVKYLEQIERLVKHEMQSPERVKEMKEAHHNLMAYGTTHPFINAAVEKVQG